MRVPFAGPSLSGIDPAALGPGVVLRPPAVRGDVARAVRAQITGFVVEAAFSGEQRRARQLFDVMLVEVVCGLTEPVEQPVEPAC